MKLSGSPNPPQRTAATCQAWREYPSAELYEEPKLRKRMLERSARAAELDPTWAVLHKDIRADRPLTPAGAAFDWLSEEEQSVSRSAIERHERLRVSISATCARVDQLREAELSRR